MDWTLFNNDCEPTIPAMYRSVINMYTGPFYNNNSIKVSELLDALVKDAQNPERTAFQRNLMDAVAVTLMYKIISEPNAKNELKSHMSEKWETFLDTADEL